MRTINKNGCSVCEPGRENYTTFIACVLRKRIKMYQYDYRTEKGDLFSCCASSLEACRAKRDKWLKSKQFV